MWTPPGASRSAEILEHHVPHVRYEYSQLMPVHAIPTENEPRYHWNFDRCLVEKPSDTTDAEGEFTAQWRLVTFAIILPLHETLFDRGTAYTSFLEPKGNWTQGRYRGLVDTFFQDPQGGSTRAGSSRTTREWRLRAMPQSPRQRFGSLLGNAVNPAQGPSVPGSSGEGHGRGASASLWHLPLNEEPTGVQAEPAPTPIPSLSAFRIAENGSAATARLYLRAVEFLQFAEAASGPEGELFNRYLVLHIVAENCSSSELEKISQALHRPRNSITVRPVGTAASSSKDEVDKPEAQKPLSTFGNLALDLLNQELGGHKVEGTVNDGGYIARPPEPAAKKAGTPHTGHTKDPAAHQEAQDDPRQGLITPPSRVVLAVPQGELPAPPALVSGAAQSAWSDAEKWAWLLSTGADKYAEALPAQTAQQSQLARCGEHEAWTTWATQSAVAVVRHDARRPADGYYLGDTRFLFLPATRFVDLVLLNMRVSQALSHLSNRLASIDSDVDRLLAQKKEPRLRGTPGSDASSAITELERLRHQLRELERIQADFVIVRDKLWFQSVPRQSTDTQVLLSIREMNGVDRLYADFTDELALRRDVYHTHYQSRELESSRAREKDRERAAKSRESLNTILAVVAAALAAPGFVEAFGVTGSVPAGVVTVLVAVILAVLGIVAVRFLTRKSNETPTGADPRTESPAADQPSTGDDGPRPVS